MDSSSAGDNKETPQVCKSDDVENANEPVEEKVPRILSPELNDVFPIFVNMLDVKSFMKLAMTSKKMYNRCMEDKAIKINVDVNQLEIKQENDSVVFRLPYLNDNYAAALRKLPCNVSLQSFNIRGDIEASKMPVLHSYMAELGVHRIHQLWIQNKFQDMGAIIAIIKYFGVKSVHICCSIDADMLRSFLHLNVEKLQYIGTVSIDFILEMETSIPMLEFTGIRNFPKEQLLHIISRIQSCSLPQFIVDDGAIEWDEFDMLSIEKEVPLPENRPLVLTRPPYRSGYCEYWFLHSNGGITRCASDGSSNLKLYKSEEWEYPWIVRKEENVFKDLTNHLEVSCNENQFRTFSTNFTVLERSHQGTLPDVRPLCYMNSEYGFWMLDDNDNLMECVWDNGCVLWNTVNLSYCKEIAHPALAKHVFWKVMEQVEDHKEFKLCCEGLNEFNSWLEDFAKLDLECSGPLPTTCPLVFKAEKNPNELHDEPDWIALHLVLIEDRLIECSLLSTGVTVRPCPFFKKIDILFTAKKAVEMPKDGDMYLNVRFSKFRDIISERAATEFWFVSYQAVCKVVRENGCLSIWEGILCESPPIFMKHAFRHFAEKEITACDPFALELGQFYSCLEQFTILPFDYSGPLASDSPLAFVKNETHHTCRKGTTRRPRCDCKDFSVLVWFVWNGMRVTYCSWGKGEPKSVVFGKSDDFNDVPLALKSKEYLKNLIQGKYEKWTTFNWFGRFNDFLSYLNGYIKLPFNYNARLANERPLVFESRSDKENPVYFILREEGSVIQCWKRTPHISMSLSSNKENFPPALKSLF